MSIAEKILRAKTDYDEVYEAGKQSEYDKFWDVFQNYGNATYYYDAFSYSRFTDENYNPKYEIICSTSVNSGCRIFQQTLITDTKVPIIASGELAGSYEPHLNEAFRDAKNLETIRKLKVFPITNYINTFSGCTALKNIIIEGTIGRNLNMQNATLLTADSMKSIISALANYLDTSNEGKYTLTFSSTAWKRLEADSASPTGSTWKDYVTDYLGWLV